MGVTVRGNDLGDCIPEEAAAGKSSSSFGQAESSLELDWSPPRETGGKDDMVMTVQAY
jgi:hypothetical protein